MIGDAVVTRSLIGARLVGGTWTALSTWTLPAVTLGGALTLNGQVFDAGSGSAEIDTTGSLAGLILKGAASTHGAVFKFQHEHTTPDVATIIGSLQFFGYDGAATPVLQRWAAYHTYYSNVGDGTEQAEFRWYMMDAGAVDNLAFRLYGDGSLWADLSVDTLTYKVSGTQVVGARVVDARCDDAINSGDATTDGVIDALRDAMITHGLIAAA